MNAYQAKNDSSPKICLRQMLACLTIALINLMFDSFTLYPANTLFDVQISQRNGGNYKKELIFHFNANMIKEHGYSLVNLNQF